MTLLRLVVQSHTNLRLSCEDAVACFLKLRPTNPKSYPLEFVRLIVQYFLVMPNLILASFWFNLAHDLI